MNRRKFLSSLVKVAGVALLSRGAIKNVLTASAYAAGDAETPKKLSMVDPKDPMASALKYAEDFKKVPSAKGNRCGSCQLYAKKEVRSGKEVGTCTIFQGKLVYSNAFCSSYTKKA